jgi:TonB family protein
MKKNLLLLLCMFCTLLCSAQERVNRVKLSFEKEGYILEKAIGWSYDEYVGEWVDCVNVLESEKKNKAYTTSPSWASGEFNNLISLQFKTITYNNQLYYALVWHKWDGAYKYPSIREDWEYWRTKVFMMFTQQDIYKLRNLTNKLLTIKVSSPSTDRYNTAADVDVIQSEMNSGYVKQLYLVIYKAIDGSIRFLFRQYDWDSYDIKTQYFEITEAEYLKLISISDGDAEIAKMENPVADNSPQVESTPSDEEEEVIYMVVEKMPEFPGGQQAMSQFLSESVVYPQDAYANGIQGRVICQFVVEKDGRVSDVQVVRSSGDSSLDKEALRVIKSMPNWTPGMLRDNPVRVKYTIPINFRLPNG